MTSLPTGLCVDGISSSACSGRCSAQTPYTVASGVSFGSHVDAVLSYKICTIWSFVIVRESQCRA